MMPTNPVQFCLALLLSGAVTACASRYEGSAPPEGSVGVTASPLGETLFQASRQGVAVLVLNPLAHDRPERVVLALRTPAATEEVLGVLWNVEGYPEILGDMPKVEVLERRGDLLVFSAELELPFENLNYTLRYMRGRNRIDVQAIGGALKGGRYCWEVVRFGDESLVVYTAEGSTHERYGFCSGEGPGFTP